MSDNPHFSQAWGVCPALASESTESSEEKDKEETKSNSGPSKKDRENDASTFGGKFEFCDLVSTFVFRIWPH